MIKEGDVITVGKTEIKVYKLPGHTAGSPSFTFTVFDNGRPHKALIFEDRVSATASRAAPSSSRASAD